MAHFKLTEIRGVIPAMLTPLGDDGEMDLNRVKALTRHLCQKPIGGLYPDRFHRRGLHVGCGRT